MMRLHEQTEVDRSLTDCFRYLADFSTSEQWDPGVYRARKLTPGAVAVGTVFEVTLNSAGRRVPMRYQLTQCDAPAKLVLRGEGDTFCVEDTISLSAVSATRTRIDYQAELHFHGPAGRVLPLLRPWLRGVGRRAVEGLSRALTPEAPPARPGLWQALGYRTLLPAAWSFTERGYLALPDKGLSERVDGRTFVITGPTSGLGLAAACELARLGGRLLLVGRGTARLQAAVQTIRDFSGCDSAMLQCFEADLSSLAELRRVAAALNTAAPHLDGLINNAGALFDTYGETADGFERALAINLIAPWVLTRALMPALQSAAGRVINVASGGMYAQPLRLDDMNFRQQPYQGSKAYARAKRALVAITEHWAHHSEGIRFHSMHPGWAATPGVTTALPDFERRMRRWLRDSRMGADTMVWLASSRAGGAAPGGQFWFDRRPRATAVLPGTAVDATQRAALVDWLYAHVGP